MTKRSKNQKTISVSYDNIRGVDFSGRASEKKHFPLLQNMYIDYEGGLRLYREYSGLQKTFLL